MYPSLSHYFLCRTNLAWSQFDQPSQTYKYGRLNPQTVGWKWISEMHDITIFLVQWGGKLIFSLWEYVPPRHRAVWGGWVGWWWGDVWSLLCKMEMSLPRFAVAKLFWNGSHWKTLGRAGKLGHLQEQGSAFYGVGGVATRAKTKELKRVPLFIQAREYTDLTIKNKMWGLNTVKAKKLFNRDLRMTWIHCSNEKGSENQAPSLPAFCSGSHYTLWLSCLYAETDADTEGLIYYAWDCGAQLVREREKRWHPSCYQ